MYKVYFNLYPIKSFSHVMSSVHENSWSWVEYLVETINKLTHDLVSLLSTTFQLTLHSTDTVINNELQQKLSDFFHECVALLAFDDFQLQLLKIFLFTFISTVALIFITWHIYGPRISERFMEPSKKFSFSLHLNSNTNYIYMPFTSLSL